MIHKFSLLNRDLDRPCQKPAEISIVSLKFAIIIIQKKMKNNSKNILNTNEFLYAGELSMDNDLKRELISKSPITMESLRKLNIGTGTLHLVQGILMLALGTPS
ncbi:MAG: hypothetical protein ABC536_04620 [Candidatus Methanosuratincola petrocarbonis]